MNSANKVAEKLEELSVNDDKTKNSGDKKEEVKEKKEEKAGEEEKKWAQERSFIRILRLPFSPFLQQTLKMKNWTLVFFLASTSQDLGATLNVSISQSLRCCELLSHSQTLISPLHFPIHCGPVISHHVFVYLHDMLWYKACAIDWFPHWVTSFVVFLLYFKELYCECLDEHCLIRERAVWVDR